MPLPATNSARMSHPNYPKVAQLKSVGDFRARLSELGVELPIDDEILTAAAGSPLAEPLKIGEFTVGNRWCIHPMEGWDANRDGSPSEHTLRRWRHFGVSGAKWIWGGEAAAVQPDGRANPQQTMAIAENAAGLKQLLDELTTSHDEQFGGSDDLLVGLQLTHSGRFCRPNSKTLEPRIAYHHPLLDAKFAIDPNDNSVVWTDDDLERLIDSYVAASHLAKDGGYRFVDIKACHGYLLHEFLSARRREGKFGGDYEGRTRLLKTIIARVQVEVPDLMVMCRLSVYDVPPFQTSREVGQPMEFASLLPYEFGFGVAMENPLQIDLAEPLRLIRELREMGVAALNITCGSPYYSPHIQRPAIFPPSDGYLPPEDPLVGVARQIQATKSCKEAAGEMPIVGSGLSYLQDYLPHVGQALVRGNWADAVGLGRMVLSYPELPADCLSQGATQRKKVCRTFSDCTTGPRAGLVSGCYPLDAYYKKLPEAAELREFKRKLDA